MQWKLANTAAPIYVEFKKDGEFVIPDAGSIYLTIRNNAGTVVGGFNRVLQADVAGSTLLLTVSSTVNLVVSGTEARHILVEYSNGGIPLQFTASYRLTAFLPISSKPEDVRNLLGARYSEVRDEDVDLFEAYYNLLRNNSGLAAALVATTDRALYANRAISLQAALTLLPSMPMRAMKEDSLNNASQIRATIDWEALRKSLEVELGVALGNMVADAPPVATFPTTFLVVTPTDPVTNA